MKRLAFFLLLSFLTLSIQAQNITAVEYFFNTDPGIGLGTPIPVNEVGEDLTITASINTEGLSVGVHTLFIRAKNDSSEWGLPIKKLVFVDQRTPIEEQQITAVEYFFDSDPGVGNGIAIAVDPANDAEILANINTAEVGRGVYTLYVRAKQQDNVWGLPIKKLVFVDQSAPNQVGQIVAGEYFLNTDPGFAGATSFSIDPGTDIEASFTVPGSLLPIGNQVLYVRVQDEFGRWGMYSSFTFNLLEVPFVELTESDTLSINEADTLLPIMEDLAISASEGLSIDSASVEVTSGFVPEVDSLFINETNDFDFEIEVSKIWVIGTGTASEYQEVFNTLTYKFSGSESIDTVKIVEFQVYSQGLKTSLVTRYLNLQIEVDTTATSGEPDLDLPSDFSLKQNYPNPFNPSSTIQFGLPEASFVRLEVFNMLGQRVSELVNEQLPTGYHSVRFDASSLASGIYIYRIQAGSFVQTKKMMLIK